MMQFRFLMVFIVFISLKCKNESNNSKEKIKEDVEWEETKNSRSNKIDTENKILNIKSDSLLSYRQIKLSINKTRSKLRESQISTDSLSRIFEELIINKIIPYWYGTTWSFEGHTAIPKEGKIACGYFVSTTLKDMGINLNRYQLAQQSPINEAKSLSLNNEIIEIHENTNEENIKAINDRLSNGFYFIGFDQNHVGFLLKRKKQLYLIHSNYVNAQGVINEKVRNSEVFASYNRFYIAEISTNESLLQNWLKGIKLEVIKEK